jgi:hypothetical protein
MLMVGGRVVVADGELRTAPADGLAAAARSAARTLAGRAKR